MGAGASLAPRSAKTSGGTTIALVVSRVYFSIQPCVFEHLCPVITGPDVCVSRCGVYVENGPPVPILSGAGLYVEDEDDHEVFLMARAEITLVTRDTTDFADVVLQATYLYNGVIQSYQGGSRSP